jgi:GAF domain-containing protein/Sel1 repeat-containing protein
MSRLQYFGNPLNDERLATRNTESGGATIIPVKVERAKNLIADETSLQAVLGRVRDSTGATGAAIALNTGEAVFCRASSGATAPPVGTRLFAGIGLTGLCLITGNAQLCNDTKTDSRVNSRACLQLDVRSVLVVPIRLGAQVVGVLEALSDSRNAFNDAHTAAMSKLVDQVLPLVPESATSEGHGWELAQPRTSHDPKAVTELVSEFREENRAGARWWRIGLAAVLALAAAFGSQYFLHRWDLPLGFPDQDHSEEQLVVPSEEAVQGTDLNHVGQSETGDSAPQYEVAERYAEGAVVPQNWDAMRRLAKAAANGSASAQWKLGVSYLNGMGVPQDDRKATKWLKRAANQGHVAAQNTLSELYFSGRGVPRDFVRAYTWASIAAVASGNDTEHLKRARSQLTALQVEDAHRKVSSWWERHSNRASQNVRRATTTPDLSRR